MICENDNHEFSATGMMFTVLVDDARASLIYGKAAALGPEVECCAICGMLRIRPSQLSRVWPNDGQEGKEPPPPS